MILTRRSMQRQSGRCCVNWLGSDPEKSNCFKDETCLVWHHKISAPDFKKTWPPIQTKSKL